MRGQKPQPTALKVLRGNPGKRPLNDREPKLEARIPAAPKSLSERAQRKWLDICGLLEPAGVLTLVDRDVLQVYCETWAEWEHATEQIEAQGYLRGDRASPYVRIRNQALTQLRPLLSEIGLTPSSRSRIKTPLPSESKSKWSGILK